MWAWLSNADNQKTLAWLGAALLAIASAGWTAYEKLKAAPEPAFHSQAASQSAAADGTNKSGQHATTGDISGNATVNITQQQGGR